MVRGGIYGEGGEGGGVRVRVVAGAREGCDKKGRAGVTDSPKKAFFINIKGILIHLSHTTHTVRLGTK